VITGYASASSGAEDFSLPRLRNLAGSFIAGGACVKRESFAILREIAIKYEGEDGCGGDDSGKRDIGYAIV
jgi:hypothetical protein